MLALCKERGDRVRSHVAQHADLVARRGSPTGLGTSPIESPRNHVRVQRRHSLQATHRPCIPARGCGSSPRGHATHNRVGTHRTSTRSPRSRHRRAAKIRLHPRAVLTPPESARSAGPNVTRLTTTCDNQPPAAIPSCHAVCGTTVGSWWTRRPRVTGSLESRRHS